MTEGIPGSTLTGVQCLHVATGGLEMQQGLEVPAAVSWANGAGSSKALCLPSRGSVPLLIGLDICLCLSPECELVGSPNMLCPMFGVSKAPALRLGIPWLNEATHNSAFATKLGT